MLSVHNAPKLLVSMLFVPGSDEHKLRKLADGGPDAYILDLEDSVAVSRKEAARGLVSDAIDEYGGTQHLYVRVNPMESGWCLGDLEAVIRPGLAGLQLPKIESAQEVLALDWAVRELEARQGVPSGTVRFLPTIETVQGVRAADSIAAASARIRTLALGLGDLQHDLGLGTVDAPRRNAAFTSARVSVVFAARLAGLEPPHDSAYTRLGDDDGLTEEIYFSRSLGFVGKHAIHPRQLSYIVDGYAPTKDEIERAQRFVSAFEEAEASGVAAVRVDNELVDYPIAWRAQSVLDLASRKGNAL